MLDPLSLGKEKLQGGTTAVVLGSVSASLSQASSTCVSFVVAHTGKIGQLTKSLGRKKHWLCAHLSLVRMGEQEGLS